MIIDAERNCGPPVSFAKPLPLSSLGNTDCPSRLPEVKTLLVEPVDPCGYQKSVAVAGIW